MKKFKVLTVESERGWKTEYDSELYETKEAAISRYYELRPMPGISAPDYYYISQGVEEFDEISMSWKSVIV